MNSPLDQLKDIEGLHLDAISWWPLAPAWWVVLLVVACAVSVGIFFAVKYFLYRRSWRYQGYELLQELESRLNVDETKDVLTGFCEALRRIAMHKTSRVECAGLDGDEWLKFLDRNDPKQYNWSAQSKVLCDSVYAPTIEGDISNDLRQMINALKCWVR